MASSCSLHLGKSLGNVRHWQPARSRYNTAHYTSYQIHDPGLGLPAGLLWQRSDLIEPFATHIAGIALLTHSHYQECRGDREQALRLFLIDTERGRNVIKLEGYDDVYGLSAQADGTTGA